MSPRKPKSPPTSPVTAVALAESSWNRAENSTEARSTRGRILTAAERLFAEHGFSNVSMPTIAKASGITAGAIYKHYDSKADLFIEVVRRTVQSIPSPIVDRDASRAVAIPRIVAMYTTPGLKLLRQLAVEIHSPSANHPKVRRILRNSLEHSIEDIRNHVAAAQSAGTLDASLDASMVASMVMVLILGLTHMETLVPQLIGDRAWHDFVQDRTAALMGLS